MFRRYRRRALGLRRYELTHARNGIFLPIHAAAAGGDEFVAAALEADCGLVGEILQCLAYNTSCDLMTTLGGAVAGPVTMSPS